MRRNAPAFLAAVLLMILIASLSGTQAAQQPAPATVAPAREVAPIDLTGYWVSIVTEDWRHRMATERKGDYESLPLNPEGRRVADTWDLAKDNAAGLQCKAFGVAALIRQPGRLHITWQDDSTLKMDFDAGTQTRLLHFNKSKQPSGEKTWQGHSIAEWEGPTVGRRGMPIPGTQQGLLGTRGAPPPSRSMYEGGSLKVMTTSFREGYLRKNGVPYSENASVTEHFHLPSKLPNGDQLLWVVTTVEDPKYLTQPFFTSTQFKREPDGSKWNPTPCRTAPPPPAAAAR